MTTGTDAMPSCSRLDTPNMDAYKLRRTVAVLSGPVRGW
jgi:hypothetical protein